MISDETFPVDLFEDDRSSVTLVTDTYTSTEESESPDFSSDNYNDRNCWLFSENSTSDKNCSDSLFETPSFDASTSQIALITPKAPTKKKKSYSCHDLMATKKNYDHVESKVKKMIENMNESERKRKMLSRHNSMPVSTQQPVDEIFNDDNDIGILIKELRIKSIKIYELEEKCDEKDSRIYSLELDKSKMKLIFDKLRYEMHDLKENESRYHELLASSPSQRKVRHASIQTDEANFSISSNHETIVTAVVNKTLDQSGFSGVNNISSDNLIPEASMEEINLTRTVEQPFDFDDKSNEQTKKPKKFRKLLKMISCVSK